MVCCSQINQDLGFSGNDRISQPHFILSFSFYQPQNEYGSNNHSVSQGTWVLGVFFIIPCLLYA